MLQPTVIAILARGPLHGYALVEELSRSPMMKGEKPNDTGVYRLLGILEQQGLVTHRVAKSREGRSKRVYEVTKAGRNCLGLWIRTLDNYRQAIGELVVMLRGAPATGAD